MTLYEATKTALRLTTDAEEIEQEIRSLITSAIADLQFSAGVDTGSIENPDTVLDGALYTALVATAVKTYVLQHFGQPDNAERLGRAYDMQKAQLKSISYGRRRDG